MSYMKYSREPIIGNPEFGVLFFGFLYLLYRGLVGHAILFILLFIPTFGLVWIWYIFNTRKYLTKKLFIEDYFKSE